MFSTLSLASLSFPSLLIFLSIPFSLILVHEAYSNVAQASLKSVILFALAFWTLGLKVCTFTPGFP